MYPYSVKAFACSALLGTPRVRSLLLKKVPPAHAKSREFSSLPILLRLRHFFRASYSALRLRTLKIKQRFEFSDPGNLPIALTLEV